MSLAFAKKTRPARSKVERRRPERPVIVAFDARPLLVRDVQDVHEYCRWRWLLACRNAMSKVLRLRAGLGDELYAPELAKNISRLSVEVDERDLWGAYREATAAFRLYVATPTQSLEERRVPSHPSEGFHSDDLPWSGWR